MEVHPPEHGIHSWRDFFVHIGTITIGLLIAIGLEGLVEHGHQRHLLHTAEIELRDELQDNRALLAHDEHALDQTQRQLEQHLAALKAAQAHSTGAVDSSLHWEWDGPQSAAWDTARDAGAIALMDYGQAASFALIYTQQKVVNDQAALYVRDIYSSNAPVRDDQELSSLSADTLSSIIADTQHTLADLRLLRAYCESLRRIYDHAETL